MSCENKRVFESQNVFLVIIFRSLVLATFNPVFLGLNISVFFLSPPPSQVMSRTVPCYFV